MQRGASHRELGFSKSLTRRGLLQGAGAFALGIGATPVVRVWAQSAFKGNPFSLGIASGDPSPDGFVIWTRLAPDPLNGGGMPQKPVEVLYEIASDPQFKAIVRKDKTLAQPALAHSVHVEVGGLEPGREYFYRFTAGAEQSEPGRAKTLPPAGAAVPELRFASAGCQRWEDGYYTAYRHLAEERFDFVVHYGDYIYEYRQLDADAKRTPAVVRRMPQDYGEATTLADYRNRYAVYKSDANLQAAHASAPFIVSFDDHEVENDFAGDIAEAGLAKVPRERFRSRRAAAFQAWYEHMPLRRAQMPKGPDILAYRRLSVGDLATLNVLDTRQYRTDQPCGDGWKRCPDALKPELGLLGSAQERWLDDGFKQSRTRWNVLAQQVMMMRVDRDPAPDVIETHMDKWDGAVAGRERLFAAIEQSKVPGAVTLTGDIHSNWAGDLKKSFDDVTSATLGVEFVATSISSGGDGGDGRAAMAKHAAINPHIKFFNNQRGYVRHIVRPERWQADFRVVDKVSVEASPIKTRKSLVSEAGKPGVVEA